MLKLIIPLHRQIFDNVKPLIMPTMKNLIKRLYLGLQYVLAVQKLKNLRSDSNNTDPENLIKVWMIQGKEPKCYFFVSRYKMAQFQEILYLYRDKDTDIGITPVYVQHVEDDLFDGYKKYMEDKLSKS